MPFAFGPRAEEKGIVFSLVGYLPLKAQLSSTPVQAGPGATLFGRPSVVIPPLMIKINADK
jgi:hypothetical protein